MKFLKPLGGLLLTTMLSPHAWAHYTPETEVVELEWIKNVRVTQGAVEGDPIFLIASPSTCSDEAEPSGDAVALDVTSFGVYVTVPIQSGVCLPEPPPSGPEHSQSILIGALPAGTHCIFPVGRDEENSDRVYMLPGYNEGNGECPLTVTVAPRGSALSSYHTGVWRDPDTTGEGIFLEVFESGSVFTYMGKGLDGGQLWLVSDMIAPDKRTGSLMLLDKGTMTEPADGIETWGELRYDFDAHSRCRMSVEFLRNGEVVKTMSLHKFASPRHQPQDC